MYCRAIFIALSPFNILVYKLYETIHGYVSEYDQAISQSQTADKPLEPRGRATQQSRDTRKPKQSALSSPSR